ncbi:MAG: hypothetical protein H0U99_06160 [Chthoniobacterales bacterium]|nr:hypothetical protein [Chthoniobacterales bacterium]
MSRALRFIVTVVACVPCISHAQGDERSKSTDVGNTLLDPASIRITDHFESPTTPTTLELAIRSVGEQVDKKRAAAAAQSSPLEFFWNASFWRYLPQGGGGSMNSPILDATEDDQFFTPEYLKLSGRILDRQMAASEKSAQLLFGR